MSGVIRGGVSGKASPVVWAAGALRWGLTPDSPQQPSPFGLGVPASPYRSPLHSTAHLGPFRPGVAQPLSGRRPCRCCTAGHGKVHVWCSAVWCGGATLVGVEGTVSFFLYRGCSRGHAPLDTGMRPKLVVAKRGAEPHS